MGKVALALAVGYAALWSYAQWNGHRIKQALPALQARRRTQNARALREMIKNDGSPRDRIAKMLLAEGFPRPDGFQPVIDAADFFDANQDDFTIAANLRPHPSIAEFRDTFLGLKSDPRVSNVQVEVTDFEEDWPYSDTVYVVTELSRDELLQRVKVLRPTELGVAKGDQLHPALQPIRKGSTAYVLWWD